MTCIRHGSFGFLFQGLICVYLYYVSVIRTDTPADSEPVKMQDHRFFI